MKPEAKNRLIAIGALLVAAGGLAFIAMGSIGENLVYYWTPSEMLGQGKKAYGPTIRLGGVVQKGTIVWSPDKTSLEFKVADNEKPESKAVLVKSEQIPPQMFREGIGVIVEGTFADTQTFSTNRLMVNHSNEYRPPKEGEKPSAETLSDKGPAGSGPARVQ